MQVTLYTKIDCPWCTSARNLLNMLGVTYDQVRVGDDLSSNDMNVADYKATIWQTFPGVVVDGVVIGGYKELAQWAVDKYI